MWHFVTIFLDVVLVVLVWFTWTLTAATSHRFVAVLLAMLWRNFPFIYHLRIFYHVVICGAYWDKPLKDIFEESRISFYCSLDMMDWNRHMNNACYNTLCDFARYRHLARLLRRGKNLAGANG